MCITKSEKFNTKYGEWALVTGASSGIGKELAQLLAQSKFNLILNARNEENLNSLSQELRENYLIETKVIAGDLTEENTIERIKLESSEINLGLTILNAGFGTSGLFANSSYENERAMLDLNCVSVFQLTHYFSKVFADKKRGGIILLSSIVAFQGTPYSAHYAATKAYVQSLGEGIAHELKPYNVDVLLAAPGPVATGFGDRARLNMSNAQPADKIALEILRALGNKTTVYPGGLTKLLVFGLSTVPRWAKTLIMKKVMKGMFEKYGD